MNYIRLLLVLLIGCSSLQAMRPSAAGASSQDQSNFARARPEHPDPEFIEGSQGRGGGAQPCATEASSQDRCAICLTDLDEVAAKNIRVTFCGHCFCRACLEKWNETSDTCPVCREPLHSKAWFVITFYLTPREHAIVSAIKNAAQKTGRIAGKVIINCGAPIAFAALVAHCCANPNINIITSEPAY